MSRDSREFEVELTVTTTHLYTTTARTPEEAESIAEGMLDDGDAGAIVYQYTESSEAVPIEDITEDDPEFEEEELDDTSDD